MKRGDGNWSISITKGSPLVHIVRQKTYVPRNENEIPTKEGGQSFLKLIRWRRKLENKLGRSVDPTRLQWHLWNPLQKIKYWSLIIIEQYSTCLMAWKADWTSPSVGSPGEKRSNDWHKWGDQEISEWFAIKDQVATSLTYIYHLVCRR